MKAFIGALKDDTCTPKPAKLNAWVHLKVPSETRYWSRSRSFLFSTAKPMLSQCHLQSSGLLWVVTVWHVHSPRPVSPLVSYLELQAGTCSAGITQCTKLPKALKEFKGENDNNKRQLEKDGREIRRVKFKTMASPPWIIDAKSADVISPVALALDVLPVTLRSQCKQS